MTGTPGLLPGVTRRTFVTTVAGIAATGCMGTPGGTPTDDGRATDQAGPTPGTDTAGPTGQPAGEEPTATPPWEPAPGLPAEAAVAETTVVTTLEVPWDLAFAGDDVYVTEREVGVRRFPTAGLLEDQGLTADDGDLVIGPEDVPDHENPPFGGFLGVAPHPGYPDPPAIYLYYSAAAEGTVNRVIRYDIASDAITTLVDGIGGPDSHLGGRITFGPDDALWITTGDNEEPETAQEPASLAGSILRVTADGDVPPTNPAIDGADPRVATYGHRNPQGLAFAPDGEGLLSEHGPTGRDEVSVVDPGANYGWPTARGGPDDEEYDSYAEHDEFTSPVVNTGAGTTWAPSGATFYTHDAIGAWTNRLFVTGLISQTLHAVTLARPGAEPPPLGEDGVRYDEPWLDDRYTATVHPLYDEEFGRLRHIAPGPNGSLFLLTSNQDGRAPSPFPRDDDDRVVRIDPA